MDSLRRPAKVKEGVAVNGEEEESELIEANGMAGAASSDCIGSDKEYRFVKPINGLAEVTANVDSLEIKEQGKQEPNEDGLDDDDVKFLSSAANAPEDLVDRYYLQFRGVRRPNNFGNHIDKLVHQPRIVAQNLDEIVKYHPDTLVNIEDDEEDDDVAEYFSSDEESVDEEITKNNNILEEPVNPEEEEPDEYDDRLDPSLLTRDACLRFVDKTANLNFPDPFNSIYSIYINRRLNEHIKNKLNLQNCRVQLHSWPVIVKNHNLTCISGPNTGKTVAHLVPIMSQIYNLFSIPNGDYELSKGVYAVIVCSSSRKVSQVAREARNLKIDVSGFPRIVTLFQANEEHQPNVIFNGCEILVTTPASFMRFVQTKIIDVTSIQILVFDDADVLLQMDARKKSSYLHEIYLEICSKKKMLKDGELKEFQTLVFAERWTKELRWVHREYLFRPLLLFASDFEATIASRLNCQICWCEGESMSRERIIKTLIQDNYTSQKTVKQKIKSKVAIVCNNKEECSYLIAFLTKTRSITLDDFVVINEDTKHFDLDGIRRKVNSKNCLLFITDLAMVGLMKFDAFNCLIHYKLPEGDFYRKFGHRFRLMFSHFKRTDVLTVERNLQLKTFLIIGPKDHDKAHFIRLFLRRLNCPLPNELSNLIDESRVQLCPRFCSFGWCHSANLGCLLRHEFNSADKPNTHLPQDGQIKFIVSYVRNASEIYIRINGFKNDCDLDNWNSLPVTFDQINPKLEKLRGQNYYQVNELKFDEVYGIEIRDTVQRCRVVEIIKNEEDYEFERDPEKQSFHVRIYCIDYGHEILTQSKKLFPLPSELRKVPALAYKAYFYGIIPFDNESEWNFKASSYMVQLFEYGSLLQITAWIVRQVNSVFWLKHLQVVKVLTYHTRTYCDVAKNLIRDKLAVSNPEQLPGSNKNIDLFIEKMRNNQIVKKSHPAFFDEVLNYAILSYYVSLDEIYLIANHKFDYLEKEEQIWYQNSRVPIKEFFPGLICLCKDSVGFKLNRARIISVKEQTVDVFFLDHGDSAQDVLKSDCFRISERIVSIFPFQAVRTKLVGVEPIDKDKDLFDEISNLTRFVENYDLPKLILVEVLNKEANCYYVRIFVEKSNETDIVASEFESLAKLLVDKGQVRFVDGEEEAPPIKTMVVNSEESFLSDEDEENEYSFKIIQEDVFDNYKDKFAELYKSNSGENSCTSKRLQKIKNLCDKSKRKTTKSKNSVVYIGEEEYKQILEEEDESIGQKSCKQYEHWPNPQPGPSSGYVQPYDPDDETYGDGAESDEEYLFNEDGIELT